MFYSCPPVVTSRSKILSPVEGDPTFVSRHFSGNYSGMSTRIVVVLCWQSLCAPAVYSCVISAASFFAHSVKESDHNQIDSYRLTIRGIRAFPSSRVITGSNWLRCLFSGFCRLTLLSIPLPRIKQTYAKYLQIPSEQAMSQVRIMRDKVCRDIPEGIAYLT